MQGNRLIAEQGSFRDRSNQVFNDGEKIVRGLNDDANSIWLELSREPFFCELVEEGKVVRTESMAEIVDKSWAGFLSHERVPFISYAYEWSFGMLRDAALLQLELIERAMESGWAMKDATSYNIQWVGCRPIFIDIPSFERYVVGSPWIGYRQFCMMFLYPLMLQAYKNVDFQSMLRGSLEGIDPAVANKLLFGGAKLRKGVLTHVLLHSKMQSRYSSAELKEARDLTEGSTKGVAQHKKIHHSKAMVLGTIQGLRRTIQALRRAEQETTWGNYDADHSYGEQSYEAKKSFVAKATGTKRRRLVWDLGANTGTFSRICAEGADYVLAVDGDAKAIDRFYAAQKSAERNNILPLIMNLGNVSPGQGWRGQERKAFDTRGKPDLILCLALMHHIVISANIPLREFLSWLRSLDSEIVIEFVSVEDDMSKMLLRNRENQYQELTEAVFEQSIAQMFSIASSEPVKGSHRKLYHLIPH